MHASSTPRLIEFAHKQNTPIGIDQPQKFQMTTHWAEPPTKNDDAR